MISSLVVAACAPTDFAGEIGQRLELVGIVSLHQNGRGDIVIVGVGKVGVLQTVGGWPPWRPAPCRSRPCPERGQQVLEGHVLHLKGKTHVVGNVLSHGHVDAGVGQFALVIGIHEFEGGRSRHWSPGSGWFSCRCYRRCCRGCCRGSCLPQAARDRIMAAAIRRANTFFHLSYLTLYSLCRLCRRPCGWKAPGVPEDVVMIQRR